GHPERDSSGGSSTSSMTVRRSVTRPREVSRVSSSTVRETSRRRGDAASGFALIPARMCPTNSPSARARDFSLRAPRAMSVVAVRGRLAGADLVDELGGALGREELVERLVEERRGRAAAGAETLELDQRELAVVGRLADVDAEFVAAHR